MPRQRTHDESVRRRLLEAASAAVAEHGAAGMSLRAVAATAGTTTAAVYSLFGGRDALVHAVVEEGFRRFSTHLAAAGRTDDPAADLLALGMAYRTNALENPHFYQVMFAPGSSSEPSAQADGTFQALVEAVARLTAAEQQDAEARAARLWAYVHGLVTLELGGFVQGDDLEQTYTAALRAAGSLITTPKAD